MISALKQESGIFKPGPYIYVFRSFLSKILGSAQHIASAGTAAVAETQAVGSTLTVRAASTGGACFYSQAEIPTELDLLVNQ